MSYLLFILNNFWKGGGVILCLQKLRFRKKAAIYPYLHVFISFCFHKIYNRNTGKFESNLKIAYSWNLIYFCGTQYLYEQASNSNSNHFVFIISSDINSKDPLTAVKNETWIFHHLNHISHSGDLVLVVFVLLLCTLHHVLIF